jgi:hypothetical protein
MERVRYPSGHALATGDSGTTTPQTPTTAPVCPAPAPSPKAHRCYSHLGQEVKRCFGSLQMTRIPRLFGSLHTPAARQTWAYMIVHTEQGGTTGDGDASDHRRSTHLSWTTVDSPARRTRRWRRASTHATVASRPGWSIRHRCQSQPSALLPQKLSQTHVGSPAITRSRLWHSIKGRGGPRTSPSADFLFYTGFRSPTADL